MNNYFQPFFDNYPGAPIPLRMHLGKLSAMGVKILHAGVTRFSNDQLERYTEVMVNDELNWLPISDMSPLHVKLMYELTLLSTNIWADGDAIDAICWWYIGQPGQPDSDTDDMNLHSYVTFRN